MRTLKQASLAGKTSLTKLRKTCK